MRKLLFFGLLIQFTNHSQVIGQTLTPGIYATSPDASPTTYVEQKGDALKTVYAGKYETKYSKKEANKYVSESGGGYITINSATSYTITNSEGKQAVMSMVLDLPYIDKSLLQAIDLPSGGKGYITQSVPFDITGNYQFDGSAKVTTQFNQDGTGKYQYALSSNEAGQLFTIRWGLLCNDSGQILAGYGNGVASYTLMIYTTKWEGFSLQYAQRIGRIVVNRDRFKDL